MFTTVGIICHGDADGLCSAAIVKSAYPGAEIYFSKPATLHKDIREFEKKINLDVLYILDVAINAKNKDFILERLKKSKEKYHIKFYDNHLLPNGLTSVIMEEEYVNEYYYHVNSSSAAATFEKVYGTEFEEIVKNRKYALLAAYGSISDYAKDCEFLEKILRIWDESSIYFQAYLLKQASRIIESENLKRTIINKLSVGILPSEITEIDKAAQDASREVDVAVPFIVQNATKFGDIGIIFDCPVASMGHNAFVTATMTQARIGIAVRREGDYAILILRKQHGELINLGEIANLISFEFDECEGGGEIATAGIKCPFVFVDDVIKKIDAVIQKF